MIKSLFSVGYFLQMYISKQIFTHIDSHPHFRKLTNASH